MSFSPASDYMLEVARGNVPGVEVVNKFGRNPNFQSTEDLWDGGGTWVAPTTARIHDIASDDANDDGSPVGTGARTIRIWGLTAWNADEVSEDITMDGTTNVATSNSYVIIHRMKVLTSGSADINVGNITATAQTDATVTARIEGGIGQTRMAIYGVPSTKVLALNSMSCNLARQSNTANMDFTLVVNENPDVQLTNFIEKQRESCFSGGNHSVKYFWKPYQLIAGPAIVKLRVVSDTASTRADGTFDGYLANA